MEDQGKWESFHVFDGHVFMFWMGKFSCFRWIWISCFGVKDMFSCFVFWIVFWIPYQGPFGCPSDKFCGRILNRILNSEPRTISDVHQTRIILTSERVNFEFQRTNSDVHQKIHWTVRPQRTNSDLHHEFHSNSEYCGGNLRWFRWLLEECSESKAYASLARSRGGRRCTPLAV